MKLIDNINDLMGDDIKQSVLPGARLKIAASCFSIYAYEALNCDAGRAKQHPCDCHPSTI